MKCVSSLIGGRWITRTSALVLSLAVIVLGSSSALAYDHNLDRNSGAGDSGAGDSGAGDSGAGDSGAGDSAAANHRLQGDTQSNGRGSAHGVQTTGGAQNSGATSRWNGPLPLPDPLVSKLYYEVQPTGVYWPNVPPPPFLVSFPPYLPTPRVRPIPIIAPPISSQSTGGVTQPTGMVAQMPPQPEAMPMGTVATNAPDPNRSTLGQVAGMRPTGNVVGSAPPIDPIAPPLLRSQPLEGPPPSHMATVMASPSPAPVGSSNTGSSGPAAASSPSVATNSHVPDAQASAAGTTAGATNTDLADIAQQTGDGHMRGNSSPGPNDPLDLKVDDTQLPGASLTHDSTSVVQKSPSGAANARPADPNELPVDDPSGSASSVAFIGVVCAVIVGLACLYYHLHRKTRSNEKVMIPPEHYEIEVRY